MQDTNTIHVKDRTVYHKRPQNPEERLPKEIAVYDLLDSLGIEYSRLDHEAIYTIDGCREVDEILGINICKNLFLCNSQKTQFYLLAMPGGKRFLTKEFSKKIGSSRLSFAPEEYMLEFLNITPGSVSVFGLMNDKDRRVSLYLDSDILKDEYFGCHPCINTSSLAIKTSDLLDKILPAIGTVAHFVDLSGEAET